MSAHFHSLFEQWPLILGWIAYGALHSLLAAHSVKRGITNRFPAVTPAYRLLYNLVAAVLLLPLLWWIIARSGPVWWAWTGSTGLLIQFVAYALIAALLLRGPGYDLRHFLGLSSGSPGAAHLRISIWHRYVRHPWYAVGLVFIWTRDMDSAWLVTCACVSAYFVIGARLEERKLIAEFGESYRAYQRRVPPLLPVPGRSLSQAEALQIEMEKLTPAK